MNSSIEKHNREKRDLLERYLDSYGNGKIFTSSRDAICILDLDGHFVLVNSSFETIFGYSVEESKQMTFQSLILIEDVDRVLNYLQKSILGQFHNLDCQVTNKLGQIIDLNMMILPIDSDGEIVGIKLIVKDITQLKRKKTEVRKIEAFHRVLTENVLDIILTTNFKGEILYVSPSCKHILGYTPDEIIGQDISILLHSEDKERAFIDREKVLTKLEYGRGSYRFINKDGVFVWMESISQPIIDCDTQNILEVVSVIRDITDRKRAEDEILSRKKAFRDLIEHLPDAVIIAKNDKILFVNETGVSLIGATKIEDVLTKSIFNFIHSDYHQIARDRLKSISEGNPLEFIEYKVIRMDGSIFDAEIKSIPTFFQNESAQHIIVRDITQRKKTQELLLNSEKLNIAGQLAAGIAHEVRNPLTAIKGFLQLMETQLDNKTYFEIIKSEIDRIELILSELLVLAKPQDLKFETVDLKSILEDVKALIGTQAILNGIQIEIINDFDSGLAIKCDKNQLKQVFINFLKNAIEAMPKGGIVTIEIKELAANKVKIIFKDTGNGIPQHILKRIGEPFFTTKEDGTGLGIMISKQIIENHNGIIHFWSDEKGTIIEIILPLGK